LVALVRDTDVIPTARRDAAVRLEDDPELDERPALVQILDDLDASEHGDYLERTCPASFPGAIGVTGCAHLAARPHVRPRTASARPCSPHLARCSAASGAAFACSTFSLVRVPWAWRQCPGAPTAPILSIMRRKQPNRFAPI